MESQPTGITDEQLHAALVDSWGFNAARIDYVPLGFGSHHWMATGATGDRRFVTVDDLDGGARSRAAAFDSLAAAFAAARALRQLGLEFVVAPLPSIEGEPIRALSDRYTIAVLPYVEGRAGSWGDVMGAAERARLIEVLAALHGETAGVQSTAPRLGFEPIIRSQTVIEAALERAGHSWGSGPFAERVRHWLLDQQPDLRALLGRADRLCAQLATAPDDLVVTHGEPHPGNVIWTDAGIRLIDWDTVGLTLRERDLWWFGGDDEALARYAQLTGCAVDSSAIALYRDAWVTSDLAALLHVFRAEHRADEDTVHAWRILESLTWSADP